MPVPHIAAINPECAKPDNLARFWTDLLGGEVAAQTPGFCAVKVGDNYLGAAHVDNHPTTDLALTRTLAADPARPRSRRPRFDDLDTAEQRAIGPGATKESHQINDATTCSAPQIAPLGFAPNRSVACPGGCRQ